MANTWVTIEDDPNIIDAVIDDEIEQLDNVMTEVQDTLESDDEEEEGIECIDVDNDVEMEPKVTSDEVSNALDCLKKFIEQNEELPDECSRAINRFERSLFRHRMDSVTKRKTNTPSIKLFFKK